MFNRISVLNHGYKIQCNALCIVRYILILKHYFLFTWSSNLTKSLIFSFAKYGNPTLKGILVIFQVNIWTNDNTWMHYASVSLIIKKTILIFIALFSLSPTLRSPFHQKLKSGTWWNIWHPTILPFFFKVKNKHMKENNCHIYS